MKKIIQPFIPNMLRRIDHRLLLRKPKVWVLSLHYVVYVFLLLSGLAATVIYGYPLAPYDLPDPKLLALGSGALSFIFLGYWIYRQIIYFREIRNSRFGYFDFLKQLLAYMAVFFLALAIPVGAYFFSSLRVVNIANPEEFGNAAFLIAQGEAYLRFLPCEEKKYTIDSEGKKLYVTPLKNPCNDFIYCSDTITIHYFSDEEHLNNLNDFITAAKAYGAEVSFSESEAFRDYKAYCLNEPLHSNWSHVSESIKKCHANIDFIKSVHDELKSVNSLSFYKKAHYLSLGLFLLFLAANTLLLFVFFGCRITLSGFGLFFFTCLSISAFGYLESVFKWGAKDTYSIVFVYLSLLMTFSYYSGYKALKKSNSSKKIKALIAFIAFSTPIFLFSISLIEEVRIALMRLSYWIEPFPMSCRGRYNWSGYDTVRFLFPILTYLFTLLPYFTKVIRKINSDPDG